MDFDQISRIRAQLTEDDEPPDRPLTAEELQYVWDRGNRRRPLPPNHSDNTKVNIVGAIERWKGFCEWLPEKPAWKPLVRTLSWENKGLAESFARYLMRRPGARIGALSTIRLYLRQLSAVFKKFTGRVLDQRVRDHFVQICVLEIKPKFGLRAEPKRKNVLHPSAFTYLTHFRWVRDWKTTFKIGLDRLDDSLIRDFLMWTGCRRHELVFARPKNAKKVRAYDEESDAYTDIDDDSDAYVQRRSKECWVCGRVDERTEPVYKVLCWEDIDLWILRDPMGTGGRDHLAMQVLLRFHKGHNKEIVPTWFPFVEEKLPLLCPISKLLAKALAEGVVDKPGYDNQAEPYFSTKLNMPAVHIPWKKEFWHKPVFRRTVEDVEGPRKSDEPLTAAMFDNSSENLGRLAGLPDRLQSYVYRRGNLEFIDSKSTLHAIQSLPNLMPENYRQSIRDQAARHRPNSTVYQRHYQNAMRNAIAQDAGLGRGTESPYLDILNHIGLKYDENAPTGVSDEVMCAIGPDSEIRRLQKELSDLETELAAKYGEASKATGQDGERRARKRNELQAAKKRQRRRVVDILRRDHFEKRNGQELDRQLHGIHQPQQQLQKVIFSLPERRILADILGDLDEGLPEEGIVRRKVDAINAWVDYAWRIEPREPGPSQYRDGTRPPSAEVPSLNEAREAAVELPARSRRIAPKPRYASMIQDPVSPSATIRVGTPILQEPPPPYSEVDRAPIPDTAPSGRNGTGTPPAVQQPRRKQPYACIFCKRCFTRKWKMWDCVERHLARRPTEAVPCPDPGCKSKGLELETELQFKNHAWRDHKLELRPKITIRMTSTSSPESAKSHPKIVLAPREQQPTSGRKIILRVGKGHG